MDLGRRSREQPSTIDTEPTQGSQREALDNKRVRTTCFVKCLGRDLYQGLIVYAGFLCFRVPWMSPRSFVVSEP